MREVKNYIVTLQPHGDKAIYKASLKTKLVYDAKQASFIIVPERECSTIIEVQGVSDKNALDKLCSLFKPEDKRRINKGAKMKVMDVAYDPESSRAWRVRGPGEDEQAWATESALGALPPGWKLESYEDYLARKKKSVRPSLDQQREAAAGAIDVNKV